MDGSISTTQPQRIYMNIKLAVVALIGSATLIGNVDAGNRSGGGGGGNFAAARSGAGRGGGAPSFRSMPSGSFSGSRMIYSGQRFSSPGVRPSGAVRPQSINPNFGAGQFARGNAGINRTNQFRNNQRFVQNGGGFTRNNNVIRNRTAGTG